MNKVILVGLISSLVLVLIMAGVLAHGSESQETEEHEGENYIYEMHEECEEFHGMNSNFRMIGHMIGWGMM